MRLKRQAEAKLWRVCELGQILYPKGACSFKLVNDLIKCIYLRGHSGILVTLAVELLRYIEI